MQSAHKHILGRIQQKEQEHIRCIVQLEKVEDLRSNASRGRLCGYIYLFVVGNIFLNFDSQFFAIGFYFILDL